MILGIKCHCSICRKEMEYLNMYGRKGTCCSNQCWEELEWRVSLYLLGLEYRPHPNRLGMHIEQ